MLHWVLKKVIRGSSRIKHIQKLFSDGFLLGQIVPIIIVGALGLNIFDNLWFIKH